MSPVRLHGVSYPKEAWRIAYSYAGKGKPPDSKFEKRMKKLGVSRSDAYALYRAIRYTPWEIEFVEESVKKSEPKVAIALGEEVQAKTS